MAHEFNAVEHAIDGTHLELPGLSPIELPLGLTRFMLMEVLAAGILCATFIPLARHVATNPVTRGRFFNMLEAVVLFVRDGIVKQGIHGHDAKRWTPFFLTLFFFILMNNLLGLVPGGATPTANVNVTGVLALFILGIVLYEGFRASGPVGFFLNLVPKLDVPAPLKVLLWPLLLMIELISFAVRHVVLALRLFANMIAGHIVLAVVLGFILTVSAQLFWLVMPMSVLGAVPLLALELMVAVLQAYVFCLLSSLFIGQAIEPHH